jgi:hypothetical protein
MWKFLICLGSAWLSLAQFKDEMFTGVFWGFFCFFFFWKGENVHLKRDYLISTTTLDY